MSSLAQIVRAGRAPYIVLLIAMASTLAGALAFRAAVRGRDEARFQNAILESEDRIDSRLDTYVALLLASRAMIDSRGGQVHPEHFRAFVDGLDLRGRYPGIQGVGFSQRILASERQAFEAARRREGTPDFRIWPDAPREELHSIVVLEPPDRRNRAAIGFDMATEEVRRDAMERARDTGQPAASGPVTLVQEIEAEKQPGFLLYVPVYRGGDVPDTVEARRAALIGFVYSPFRMEDLLHGIFGAHRYPRVGFDVRDRADPELLLHRSGQAPSPRALRSTSTLDVAGRTWTLEFWTLPAFERGSSRWLWPYVVVVGVLTCALLFAVSKRQAGVAEQLRIRGQVLDSMSEGVSVSDESGLILYTNPAEDAMFGYERGELRGKHVTVQNRYEPAENARIVRAVIDDLRQKGIWTGEFDNVKKDGTAFVTSAHITGLSVGGRTYWLSVQEDVTEKKRSEQERQELLAREQALRVQAEAASRTKDEFLAMLGHELRNPLAPIVTALALLEHKGQLRGSREVAVITRQVAHLQRLVDDLLDVSAITRGKIKLDKRPLEVLGAVEGAVELVRPLLDEKRQSLEVRVPPDVRVEADEARLVQIIGNLLHNAAKYTHPGGHISLDAEREGDVVAIRVRDDGEGIAPETLGRVFDLFEQGARGADRAEGGLGIGLAVVRSLVQLHGGTVDGESPGPGKGSEFVVRLPLLRASEELRNAGAVASPSAPPGRGRRVLVVDDNADAAEMLGELMQLAGHEVAVAYEGKQALALASSERYDVAILDIGLPGMSGYELAAKLREARAARTLIAVTGYGQDRDRTRAREAGFDHHFVKPVDTAQLLDAVAVASPAGS